jgi:hypothetical protein
MTNKLFSNFYGEFDASFKTNNQTVLQRFSSFVPRVVIGTGGKTEFGLIVTENINPSADLTTLVPAVKYRFYQNEKKDVALFARSQRRSGSRRSD